MGSKKASLAFASSQQAYEQLVRGFSQTCKSFLLLYDFGSHTSHIVFDSLTRLYELQAVTSVYKLVTNLLQACKKHTASRFVPFVL